MKLLVGVSLQTMHQIHFWPGLCPRFQQTLVGWGRDTPYLSHQCLRCLPPLLKIAIFHFRCWHSVAIDLIVTYLCSGVLQSDIAHQLQNHCWIRNVVCRMSCLHLLYSHTPYLQCSESVQYCFLLAFKIYAVSQKKLSQNVLS